MLIKAASALKMNSYDFAPIQVLLILVGSICILQLHCSDAPFKYHTICRYQYGKSGNDFVIEEVTCCCVLFNGGEEAVS